MARCMRDWLVIAHVARSPRCAQKTNELARQGASAATTENSARAQRSLQFPNEERPKRSASRSRRNKLD